MTACSDAAGQRLRNKFAHVCKKNTSVCRLRGQRQCYVLPVLSSVTHTGHKVVWLPWLPSGGRTRRVAGAPSRLIGWRSTRAL